MNLTLEKLPQAVDQLNTKLENIERLLLSNNQVTQPDSERWFDINELCEYHPEKPAKATVYTWVRERRIPFHKRGKKLTFLKSEIDRNIIEARVKSVSEVQQNAEDLLANRGGRK